MRLAALDLTFSLRGDAKRRPLHAVVMQLNHIGPTFTPKSLSKAWSAAAESSLSFLS
jgi:hypothetical protein